MTKGKSLKIKVFTFYKQKNHIFAEMMANCLLSYKTYYDG